MFLAEVFLVLELLLQGVLDFADTGFLVDQESLQPRYILDLYIPLGFSSLHLGAQHGHPTLILLNHGPSIHLHLHQLLIQISHLHLVLIHHLRVPPLRIVVFRRETLHQLFQFLDFGSLLDHTPFKLFQILLSLSVLLFYGLVLSYQQQFLLFLVLNKVHGKLLLHEFTGGKLDLGFVDKEGYEGVVEV